ncbi:glycoside hydrolase domain-containing protein [Streptomyces sp. NPDC049627]|uniref:glycoside hydrolase domain-containing protein n=1 Tax=Streptomyces sp. NPDC049627 TaxID=3365595 RepID=UPI0037BB0C19
MANAEDAAVKATSAGLPQGSVIYLDWELGGPPADAGKKYCSAWFHRLAELGYRPGVYCRAPSSLAFRKEYPGLYVGNVNLLPASVGGITIVDGALEAALASIRIEPLRESAHRAVVSAHLAEDKLDEAQGNRALRHLLCAEPAVEPSVRFARMIPQAQQ